MIFDHLVTQTKKNQVFKLSLCQGHTAKNARIEGVIFVLSDLKYCSTVSFQRTA